MMFPWLKSRTQPTPSESPEGLRKASDKDLHYLRFLVDKLPYPAWVRDKNLQIVYCNAAYADALDLTTQDVLQNNLELGASVIAEEGKALAARALKTDVLQSESHHVVVKGKRLFYEFSEIPVIGGQAVVGYAIDYTGMENAQTELERHISAHHDVLEYLGTAIAVYGNDKRLTFYNAAFAALWQLEEEYLSSEPTFGEVLEKLRETRRIPEQADFQSFKKSQSDMFHRLLEPKQELLHLPDERTLKLMIIPNPLGGLMFSYENVTDRFALERNYKTLHAVQQATLDNLFEGIAVFGSNGKLRLTNPAASKMWLIPLEDLTATPALSMGEVLERIQPLFVKVVQQTVYWGKVKRRLLSVLQERKVRNGRLKRTDGSIIDYTVMPLPDGSTMLSFVDVTATTNVETALIERNQALEKAERLKSQFIAHVSYELRTPLNAIMGFAEMVKTGMVGTLNAKQQEYMADILSSAHHLKHLIDDVIDLAAIEAGYVTLTKERCEIKKVLAELLTSFKQTAAEKGVSFAVTGLTKDIVCFVDTKRLQQVIKNLVQNAVQYTPQGGTVTVAFAALLQGLEITVQDTGVGIATEDQARIFAKFERGRSMLATTGRASGSGLGLALVQEIVVLHGGTLSLESVVGQGTTVRCVLQ